MIRLVLLAMMALASGCTQLAPIQDPSVSPGEDDDLAALLRDTQGMIVDPIEFDLPQTTESLLIQRALESEPPKPKTFWQQLVGDFSLQRLPPEYEVEKQWQSLRRNNPELLTDFLARGRLWLNYIASEIDRRGMPAELALLPYVESGFQLTARSHRGAAGPWQLMPATATYLGLQRTRSCDQRLDVIAATDAALNYLEDLARQFDGDWYLAIAAYNSGPGRVSRAVAANKKRNKPTDYFSLRLPRETQRYVPRLLALAEVVRDPQRFNVSLPEIPQVPMFETLELESAVDLELLARWSETTVSDIRSLNPCLRRFATPIEGSTVVVPVGTAGKILTELRALPADQWAQLSEYVVRSGDTLGGIALRFDTSVADLKASNGLKSNLIRVGQVLRVQGGNQAYADAAGEHIVKAGESLWTISRQYGLSLAALQNANRVGSILRIGQRLTIPAR
ncbi:MAG: LysM peptidoglycan-binding domain-containing protein [Litorivicinus sp.]